MIVETSRLRLRLLTAQDAEFMIELVNDPAWLKYIGDRNVHTRNEAETYIEKYLAMHRRHGVCLLAAELKATGAAIGTCGLLKRPEYPDFDLGYAFLERFRGQGFAREAALALLRHGHETLGRKRILALTHPANTASTTLLKKLGFAFESSVTSPDGTVETSIFAHTTDAEPPRRPA